MSKDEFQKEVALCCSYIYYNFPEKFNGTIITTFDRIYTLVVDFVKLHENTVWGETLEWDEELEKHFINNYLK